MERGHGKIRCYMESYGIMVIDLTGFLVHVAREAELKEVTWHVPSTRQTQRMMVEYYRAINRIMQCMLTPGHKAVTFAIGMIEHKIEIIQSQRF